MPVSDAPSLESDLALLKAALDEAATIAIGHYERGAAVWAKPDSSLVTEADLAVDALLKERLGAARPSYGWLSEETRDDPARLEATKLFIVDPIDGTRAFVKRKPHWTICAAVVDHGRPVAAVVINPLRGERFEAVIGRGARLNGELIEPPGRVELTGARLVGPAEAYRNRHGIEPWPAIDRENFSSLAYRLCNVAAGWRDGAVSLSLSHEWDIAAAQLIVTEAGGFVTELDGMLPAFNKPRPITYGVVAAGQALYPEIYRRVRDLAPARGPDEIGE